MKGSKAALHHRLGCHLLANVSQRIVHWRVAAPNNPENERKLLLQIQKLSELGGKKHVIDSHDDILAPKCLFHLKSSRIKSVRLSPGGFAEHQKLWEAGMYVQKTSQ